jgi:hypothetical protein
MIHSLRDIKKTNSKKYGGVDEILLRQNFSHLLEGVGKSMGSTAQFGSCTGNKST